MDSREEPWKNKEDRFFRSSWKRATRVEKRLHRVMAHGWSSRIGRASAPKSFNLLLVSGEQYFAVQPRHGFPRLAPPGRSIPMIKLTIKTFSQIAAQGDVPACNHPSLVCMRARRQSALTWGTLGQGDDELYSLLFLGQALEGMNPTT